jgi:transposase
MSNYSGKRIFVGIDVHKKTYSVSAVCDGEMIKKCTMVADPASLLSFLKNYFQGATIESAYEAGFSGFGLHRFLVGHGILNRVVHPASIEIAARERVKNDKRDSAKIATQLAAGRLRAVHIPTLEREDFRAVSRLREQLVVDRRKKSIQMKMYLHQLGKIGPKESFLINHKRIKLLLASVYSQEQKFVLTTLANQWLSIDAAIDKADDYLQQQATKDANLEVIYRSLPGVGAVIARALANELGDMSQFANEGRLFSYCGLTPSEYSSGEHTRTGHITRQGKPVLRRMLVQAAWVAIDIDKELFEFYERVSRKGGKKRAIVAVARRLIGHAKTCLKQQRPYQVNKVSASTVMR